MPGTGQLQQDQAPGRSLVPNSVQALVGAGRGGLQPGRTSELRVCGLDALLRHIIVEGLKYNVPIKPRLPYGPDPRV